MNEVIKVGFCVSYDWELLRYSIPPVYKEADTIVLGIDKNRLTWSGLPYKFDEEAFRSLISEIDVDNKVIVYEDNFSRSNFDARENCNLQRTLISEKMGIGGWHIQVDSDEYFLDFTSFVRYLLMISPSPSGDEKPLNVLVNLIPIYKKLDQGYLVVDFGQEIPENAPFATNSPDYQRARNNGHFNKLSESFAVHETWARSEEQLTFKLDNWGHSSEELKNKKVRRKYIEQWLEINEDNYQSYQNVHPATPESWPSLKYVKAQNRVEFLKNIEVPAIPLTAWQLHARNNRNIARIKHLFSR